MIDSDEGITIIWTDGKVINTTLGNNVDIKLVIDEWSRLGSLDGSFYGSNDGKFDGSLPGDSIG